MAANNLKFTISAVDKTKQAFSAVKRGLGSVTSAVFSFKGALAGAVGIGGLGLLVKNSLEATDRIGKLSKVVGISTKDLQTFKLAAEIGGMELASFTKGTKRFIDNIGDFVDGVGEAKVTFEKLGIAQSDVIPIQNDTVAMLGLVADKLNSVEDGAMKSKFAIEIFGGRGSELINVLAGGSEQLRKFSEESQRFGSLNDAQVRAVEAFNDSVVRMKTVFANVVNQIVANMSPALLKLSEHLREKVLKSFEDTKGGIGKFSKDGATSIITFVQRSVIAFQNLLNNSVKTVNGMIDIINSIPFMKDAKKITVDFDFTQTIEQLKEMKDAIKDVSENTENTVDNIAKTTTQAEKGKMAFEGINVSIKEVADIFLVKANAEFAKINDVIATGILSGIKSISDSLAEAIVMGKKLENVLRNIAQRILVQIISKQIEERLVKIANIALDKLKEILLGKQKKKVDEHLTLQKKQNAALKTELALRAAIALFTGGSGGGGGGFKLPFMADGGRLGANQPAIVGERGKELFIPDTSGTVVPNNQIREGLGGTTNINFSINATDVKGVKELLIDNRSVIVNIVNSALNQKGKPALV